MTRYHVHITKPGLIRDLVASWPVDWVKDDDGNPFPSLDAAIQAVIDVPTKHVPMGCPSPDAEGVCPGHPD